MALRMTAFLLIPLILGVSLSRMVVFTGFQLNKNFIASKLCENRDKAWMHCEGKCFLAKKMKEVEEKERKQDRETQKHLVQDSFTPEMFFVFFGNKLTATFDTPYYGRISSGHHADLFQPPQV